MNRNDFLKRLGLGAAAVAMAPEILANVSNSKPMEICIDLASLPDHTCSIAICKQSGRFVPVIEKRFWPYMKSIADGTMIATPEQNGVTATYVMRQGAWIPVTFD